MGIKDFFFTTEGGDETPKAEATTENVEATEQATEQVTEQAKVEAPSVKMNEDVLAAIKNALDEANLDGYDYYEFMKSIAEQTDMPSEKKKYEVVFSVVKNMGVTTDHLVNSASHYIQVIGEHRSKFDANINDKEQEMVVKLHEKAESIENTITAKSDQIEALKAEIKALSEEKIEVVNVATENGAQIATLRQEGSLAYDAVVSQIEDGKNKITKYLS